MAKGAEALANFSFEVGGGGPDGTFIAVSEQEPYFCFIRETEEEVIALANSAVAEYAEFVRTHQPKVETARREVSITTFRGRKIPVGNPVAA